MPAACFLIGLACGVVGASLFLNGSRNESSKLSETGGAERIRSAKTGAVLQNHLVCRSQRRWQVTSILSQCRLWANSRRALLEA